MIHRKIKVKVPGKLFIAGEYAVLEPGYEAIVVAINRYIHGEIQSSDNNHLSLPDIGYESITWSGLGENISFSINDKRLGFIQNAIKTTDQYLHENGIQTTPVSLHIHSELDSVNGKKLGLGSSAAIVVTVVTALLSYYRDQINFTEEHVFKLSAIAHYITQGNGSCADIGASTYGGWIRYSCFHPEWLLQQINEKNKALKTIIDQEWPLLLIKNIDPPKTLLLCVGWTGESASTKDLVNKVKMEANQENTKYQQFLSASMAAVSNIVSSLESNDVEGAIVGLKQNREAIHTLGELSNVAIETKELRKLIQIADKYGAGKSSGAGGGDCGIAFIRSGINTKRLLDEWKQEGIEPLELTVSKYGALSKFV